MKIDEYIRHLEQIKKEHGNLDVETFYHQSGLKNEAPGEPGRLLGERVPVLPPSIGYRRTGPGRAAFYSPALDRPATMGEPVVVI